MLNSAAYFTIWGADGFYEYSGGEPEKISSCIKTNYFTCKSGTDGQRYYACAGNSNGTELLVYDPLYSLWHKEDNTEFIDFVRYNKHLYGVTKTDIYKFSGESDEEINWCVVSKKFTLDDFDFKGINTVYLRLDLKSGSKLKYTQPGTMRILSFAVRFRAMALWFTKCRLDSKNATVFA